MLELIVVIVTVFNMFFGANRTVYHGTQAEVRQYQAQYPQAVGNPYGSQGVQVYYYGQPTQTAPYPQGY
jgi:hypothetical protein